MGELHEALKAKISELEAALAVANALIDGLSTLLQKHGDIPGVTNDEPLPNSGEYNGYDI